MSSISFSTAAVIPASARPTTRLRLTMRGRAVLLAFASVPLAVGIAFAALSGGSAIASGSDAPAASIETVTVMPGDTLWSIATSVAPDADPRDVIGDISRMNLLRGGGLQIGQELAIPAQYGN
ncbi:LysM peptidoglycan-binding domain-containing protein [Microbacterium oxydans]|jgi:Tfp pilus assembly protein FimV|uniref:LysM peptidoglycan-binding domain-containing protein n=1 Tax=Microbacterium oxydans TaxID=82380 RepID=UPI00226B70DE|nr:LysM peptidoglycan-binding domain-containing protein [Microbacterium oxydans]WAA64900.1 LysM peptidoglycan-binding domain-containing protein [Microbacterium oxydans]